MKKITTILVAFAMVLMVSIVPIVAQAVDPVTTNVTVGTGGGDAPIIKGVWEQDQTADKEDGDTAHLVANPQFLPSCEYEIDKLIDYYAIATDAQDGPNLAQVWVDVYHPDGSFKYELVLANKITDTATAMALIQDASDKGLITLGDGYTLAEIQIEFQQGAVALYYDTHIIDYEQQAGEYTANFVALDTNSNSVVFSNNFDYIPTTCFSIDNDNVQYPSLGVGDHVFYHGNTNYSIGDGAMTVRNLGNTNLNILVGQDDMDFGQQVGPMWNVQYDGRLGHLVDYTVYDPAAFKGDPIETFTLLNGAMAHSTDEKLDFSIQVIKAVTGDYTGSMVLTSQIEWDIDGDGLTDTQEHYLGYLISDPFNADTDGDGTSDADEDADGDGVSNIEEFNAGTDPLV